MTTDFWDSPPDREVTGHGECTITVVFPPFHPFARRTPASVADFAPNDPARARAFAESFPTIEAVLEELPPTNTVRASPWTRADLDVVSVGCWGNIIAIADYALADGGLECPLLDATSALSKRYPDARIFGTASIDRGENHVETSIHLPGGLRLYIEGWPAVDDQPYLDGDPHAIVQAIGIAPEVLAEQYIDLDGEPWTVAWSGFDLLAWPYDPWGWEALEMSQFRVRHTEDATSHMEEIWLDS